MQRSKHDALLLLRRLEAALGDGLLGSRRSNTAAAGPAREEVVEASPRCPPRAPRLAVRDQPCDTVQLRALTGRGSGRRPDGRRSMYGAPRTAAGEGAQRPCPRGVTPEFPTMASLRRVTSSDVGFSPRAP